MKKSKVISSIFAITVTVFCIVLFTSNTTVEKSNSENILQLKKEISYLQKDLKQLETKFKDKSSLSGNPFLGEIVLFGGNFAPRGWAFCEGQLLSINQNTALFSLLGTMYGGDGRTTFALPYLTEKDASGKIKRPRYIIALQGTYPSRS